MSVHTFSPEHRLHVKAEYDRVFARKASVADSWLVVHGCENEREHPRMGLVVSAKVGNAVTRNRWKRLLREAFRAQWQQLPRGVDLVVIPRRGAGEPQLDPLTASLGELARRVAHKLEKKKPCAS